MRVGVERGYVVILEYTSRSSEKLFHCIQRTIPGVNEAADVKRKAEVYFNLSLFFLLVVFFKFTEFLKWNVLFLS